MKLHEEFKLFETMWDPLEKDASTANPISYKNKFRALTDAIRACNRFVSASIRTVLNRLVKLEDDSWRLLIDTDYSDGRGSRTYLDVQVDPITEAWQFQYKYEYMHEDGDLMDSSKATEHGTGYTDLVKTLADYVELPAPGTREYEELLKA